MKARDISSKAELYPKLGRIMLKSVTETIEEDRQCEGDGMGRHSREFREFRVFSAAQRAIMKSATLSMPRIPMATIRGAPIKDI